MSNNETIARVFFNKFGFGPINIDKFDMFIIDAGLAADPETEDRADIRWKAFITERSEARNKLNTAGKNHEDNPFFIDITISGQEYLIKPWAQRADELPKVVATKVRRYTSGRIDDLNKAHRQASRLLLDHPNDPKLREAAAMLKMVAEHGGHLEKRLVAETVHFEAAVESVFDQTSQAMLTYDAAPEFKDRAESAA